MRVPDLDWPADLFTDAIMPVADSIKMLAAAGAPKPGLWTDMANAWTGRRALVEARWPEGGPGPVAA